MFSIGGPRAGKCNFGGPLWGGKSLRTTALDEFVVRNLNETAVLPTLQTAIVLSSFPPLL